MEFVRKLERKKNATKKNMKNKTFITWKQKKKTGKYVKKKDKSRNKRLKRIKKNIRLKILQGDREIENK